MLVQTSTCLQPVVVVVVVGPPAVVVRAAVVVALPKVFVLPRARPRALSNVVAVVITSLQSSWNVQTFWRQLEEELEGSDTLEEIEEDALRADEELLKDEEEDELDVITKDKEEEDVEEL